MGHRSFFVRGDYNELLLICLGMLKTVKILASSDIHFSLMDIRRPGSHC